MVDTKQRKKRENFLSSMNKFTSFMIGKGITLNDREYLLYKEFLWKRNQIEKTDNWIEMMLGYIFTNFKPKTLFVCDHITACLVRHKAKKILSHKCGITTSFDVVSDFELRCNINNYKNINWDRVVVYGNSKTTIHAKETIYITSN